MSAGADSDSNSASAPGVNPALAYQLPADTYYHLVQTLRLALPPPLTDSPDDLRRRDHAAIAGVAALAPANAAEAELGAQFVAASEQWKACLRLAQQPGTTPEWAAKCRAQATSMMRQANSALGLLLRMQAARRKLEADSTARDRLAWTEYCALGLMAEALKPNATSPANCEPAPAGHPGASHPDPLGPGDEGATVPLRPQEQDAEQAPPPAPEPQEISAEAAATAAEHPCIAPPGAAEQYAATDDGTLPHRRAA